MPSGSIGVRTKTYLGELGEIAGSNPSTGTYSYYVTDHLGSTRRILDGNRAVLARYDYMPYGGPLNHAGLPLDRGFTGHQWDPASDAYYAPYRYYAPGMARWMTRDPIGFAGGWNLYGYVGGSPVAYTDPLGLFFGLPCLPFVGIVTTLVGVVVGEAGVRGGSWPVFFVGVGIGLFGLAWEISCLPTNIKTYAKLLRKMFDFGSRSINKQSDPGAVYYKDPITYGTRSEEPTKRKEPGGNRC